MLAEGAQRLSDGFVKGLRGDMDGMLDARGIEPGDLIGCFRLKPRKVNFYQK